MASVTFPPELGGSGITISDDDSPATGLDGGGHRTRFVPALQQTVAVAGHVVAQVQTSVEKAAEATTQAGIATTQAGIATGAAGTATAQAGVATTQAGIATTKAGEANNSALAAAADRVLAQQALADTEAARNDALQASNDAVLQVATIDYKVDWQQAATNIARYGADQPHPGLDLQFQGATLLDPRVEFSRPGAGWVMGPAGLFVERGADVPRFAYDPVAGVPLGLLVEPAETAIKPNPIDSAFSDSFIPFGSTNQLLISPRSYPSPDGGNLAGTVTQQHESWSESSSRMQINLAGYPASVGDVFSLSWYEKQVSGPLATVYPGGGALAIRSVVGLTALSFGPVTELLGGWRRFQVRFRIDVEDGQDRILRLYFNNLQSGSTAAFFGWMITKRDAPPLSYIPVSVAAVTRPADVLHCDMQQLPGFSAQRGAIVVDWTDLSLIGQPIWLSENMSTSSGDSVGVSRQSSGNPLRLSMRVGNSPADIVPIGSIPVGQRLKVALRWEGTKVSASMNGAAPIALASTGDATSLNLRYLLVGNASHAIFRSVRWYPFPLTDAQLQAFSTL